MNKISHYNKFDNQSPMDFLAEKEQNKVLFKILEINPMRLYSSVQQIYIHPLHFTHIVHRLDNYIYLYDQLSMEILGKSKVQILSGMKLFAFTSNFNIFYGLKQREFILAFQLQKDGTIIHRKLNLSPTPNMDLSYLQAHTFTFVDECSKLICINQLKMYFLDCFSGQIWYIPQLKYEQKTIQTSHSVRINSYDWIIGFQNYLYSISFNEKLNGYKIYCRVQVGNIKKLGGDHKRNNCKNGYAIDDKNQVTIFFTNFKTKVINILKKISFFDSECLYVNFFKFSVNTSTTNKFQNHLYLMFYCKKLVNFQIPPIKHQMIQENLQIFIEKEQIIQGYQQFQQIIPNQYFNYIMKLEISIQNQREIQTFAKTRYIMRDMPQIKISPWFNELAQNGYFYLCSTGQIIMIDLAQIKQFEVKAQQWVSLGYRFQALSKNEVYQQKIDQFQQQQNLNAQQQQIKEDLLDSYQQSGLSEYLIVKNKVVRLKCFQI